MSKYAGPAPEASLQRASHGLRENGFAVDLVDRVDDARRLVRSKLSSGQSVFTAVSETLRLSGIAEDIDASGRYHSIRAQLAGLDPQSPEARRLGATPDVIVGSVQAITEDGRLVVASATGSQIGPYAAGADQVIWVVGAQKVVASLDAAVDRVRSHCVPLESERCQRVYGGPSAIRKWLVIESEAPDRCSVVLVREAIGF